MEKKRVNKIHENHGVVERDVYNDPIAERTEWRPLSPGGSNFRTTTLRIKNNRAKFGISISAIFFFLAYFGISSSIIYICQRMREKGSGVINMEMLVTFGCVLFILAGVYWFMYLAKGVVFDKTSGEFVSGKERLRFENIHAIQLVREMCITNAQGGKQNYYSYEINIVTKEGERVNVTDHGNKKAVRRDGKKLAKFLGVPLWDAIENKKKLKTDKPECWLNSVGRGSI